MQKAHNDIQSAVPSTSKSGIVISEDGTVIDYGNTPNTTTGGGDDDDASTRAIASPGVKESFVVLPDASSSDDGPTIPTIRISTESNREKQKEEPDPETDHQLNGQPNGVSDHDSLEKPEQAAANDGEQDGSEPSAFPPQEPFSFSNKRLCERWLDNLFMVLYEVREIIVL